MDKVDLFEVAVRYLAIKPLKFDKYDFAEAQEVIKVEKISSVTFIGEHDYFEKSLDAMLTKVAITNEQNGTIYINIKGLGCSDRVKRKLFELSQVANTIIIFGEPEKWPRLSPNIKFSKNDDIFTDNHQRFFIYHSSGMNIALVSRHDMHEGREQTEALITNDPEAVALLGVTVGTKAYPIL
ncbi:MAG: hypothetical protein WCP14_04345 [bacterium]